MRIEEIANLAGVSISTVSKIVNGKDKGINPKTRERVLAIVKKHNYVPYASIKKKWDSRTFLIGLLLGRADGAGELQRGVTLYARENNYGVVVCDSSDDYEEELRNIAVLCRSSVDGVIWEPVGNKSSESARKLEESGIPVITAGRGCDHSVDYHQLGYKATQLLMDYSHRRIGCLLNPDNPECADFLRGFRECMFESRILLDEKNCILDARTLDQRVFHLGITAFVCFDEEDAERLYELAESCGLHVPANLSLVALARKPHCHDSQRLSLIPLPLRDFGVHLCGELIDRMEHREGTRPAFGWDLTASDRYSIDLPYNSESKSILVVGSIHMDNFVTVERMPHPGETAPASAVSQVVGGKGLNQAIGCTRLGGGVSLIARVGHDYESIGVHMMLSENHIESQGIATDKKLSTGKAYIYVQKDGDNSIIIYSGANRNLSPADVHTNKSLFKGAGYCLITMEIPAETAAYAARTARAYGVRTILKPSAQDTLSDGLLADTDIIVPNALEAARLCPQASTVEEQAACFVERGAGCVIITLGVRGCYLLQEGRGRYFPAADFPAVDTTGASDAFIAALAVSLNEGKDMEHAVRFATVAAGFCVSRQGTVPALVDRSTLDIYQEKGAAGEPS